MRKVRNRADKVVGAALKSARSPMNKEQREEDIKDLPQKVIPHEVSIEKLNALFGKGSYKSMSDEIYWQPSFRTSQIDCGKAHHQSVCRNRWSASG